MIHRCLSLVALTALAATGCRRSPPPPEVAVESLTRWMEAADGQALWQYLPSSMKSDLAGLLQRFGRAVDPDVSKALDALVGEAAQALSHQDERLDRIPPLREKVATGEVRHLLAQSLIQALQTGGSTHLLSSAAGSQERLERAGPALAKVMLAALRAGGSPLVTPWRPGRFHVQPLPDGRVAVTWLDGRDQPPEALVLVDGHWLPERWVTAWSGLTAWATPWLAGAKDSALVSHGPQILRLLNQTRARLRRLHGVADQDGFDRAIASSAGTLSLAITWAITRDPAAQAR